jgi:RNA polymerase sigma factor (sigma-70 family)
VKAGEERAFAILFNEFRPVIYTHIRRISGSESLAQEIVQDTFLKIWLKRDSLAEIEHFGGWIYKVASNIAYTALTRNANEERRLQAFKDVNSSQPAETFTTTERMLLEKEYSALLQDAVRLLPERQLMAYQLTKEQGLTREQAAEQMGISSESVKTNLAMALQKIRAYCLARMGPLGLLLFLWANR